MSIEIPTVAPRMGGKTESLFMCGIPVRTNPLLPKDTMYLVSTQEVKSAYESLLKPRDTVGQIVERAWTKAMARHATDSSFNSRRLLDLLSGGAKKLHDYGGARENTLIVPGGVTHRSLAMMSGEPVYDPLTRSTVYPDGRVVTDLERERGSRIPFEDLITFGRP